MPSAFGDIELVGDEDDGTLEYPPDTPLLTQVLEDDFPSYFTEQDGRLFHSRDASSYPLPVDTPEQERLNAQHIILNELIGAHYVGPVPEVLAPNSERQNLVLDLCTGTGRWPMDMARDFPDVLFRGLDMVPIATRYPLPNVQFELHDVNERCRWDDNTVDVVHARSISMAVHDYPGILREVGRMLRPGGLFVSCEWGRYPAFDPSLGLDAPSLIPGICRFFEILHEALEECRGIHPIGHTIPELLVSAGLFNEVTPQQFYVPIGPWHTDPSMQRIGRAFRVVFLRYADSVRPLLREAGWTDRELDETYEALVHDLRTVQGQVGVYHTVYARKA